jgi:hypothetical protein
MRPLQARCQLGLGRLYRRIGRPGDARTALGASAALLRDLDSLHWRREAETELADVQVER